MNRKLARPLLSLTVAGALLGATASAALADALPPTPTMGEVIALENTHHLFIADEAGALHLAADPKALAGQPVDWFARKDISLSDLRQFQRGDPFLSLALVRIGEAVYLPQARAAGGAPVLRLVKPADLPVIGVTPEDFGRLVLEQGAWEARYGLRTSDLPMEDLSLDGAPAVGPAAPQEPTQSESTTA